LGRESIVWGSRLSLSREGMRRKRLSLLEGRREADVVPCYSARKMLMRK
jgi:hypothetical protein